MGVAAGIVALVVLFGLLAGFIVNQRRLIGLRERRDELQNRMAGLEMRLGQLAETERRQIAAAQAAARRSAAQPAVHGAPAHTGVRRVPPPRVPIRRSGPAPDPGRG